jgi:hypothetical protein
MLSTSPSSYVAPPINGTYSNTTWYAADGEYINVAVTGTSLIRADDYALVNTGMGWTAPPAGLSPYKFTGNFDSAPDTGFTTSGVGLTLNSYGEGLLGSYNAGSFVIGTNYLLSSFGFRIASITNMTFDVTIQLFGSTDGSGTPLQTLSLSSLTGGGNCSSLSPASGAPVPCNTAPFLFISATGLVHSFSIATNDPTGFYIDDLDLSGSTTPEPATMLITGGGLLALAYVIRRRRVTARQ